MNLSPTTTLGVSYAPAYAPTTIMQPNNVATSYAPNNVATSYAPNNVATSYAPYQPQTVSYVNHAAPQTVAYVNHPAIAPAPTPPHSAAVQHIVQGFKQQMRPKCEWRSEYIQVPKTIQVPKMIKQPQVIQVPKEIFETKMIPIQVPRIIQVPEEYEVEKVVTVPRVTQVEREIRIPVQRMIKKTIKVPKQVIVTDEEEHTVMVRAMEEVPASEAGHTALFGGLSHQVSGQTSGALLQNVAPRLS